MSVFITQLFPEWLSNVIQEFLAEVVTWSTVRHDRVLQCYGCTEVEGLGQLCLIFPSIKGKSARDRCAITAEDRLELMCRKRLVSCQFKSFRFGMMCTHFYIACRNRRRHGLSTQRRHHSWGPTRGMSFWHVRLINGAEGFPSEG